MLDELFPFAPDTVKVALWFHDFVYDTYATDNEEQSAIVAINHCPPYMPIKEIKQLILATKQHIAGDNQNAQILLDVDLSILSEPPEVFDKYERDIRLEYDWVSQEAYREGRTKILKMFLDREAIYYTEAMKPREAIARNNIYRSLKSL